MSATHRSSTTRIAHDNYPTPSWCVRRLLEACPLPGGVWLEPCAGEGAIIRAVNEARPENAHTAELAWHACELREECASPLADLIGAPSAVTIASYLDVYFSSADVIITNPPFSLAEAITRKALSEAPWVAMLLSLSFVKASKRAAWLASNPPDRYDIPQPVCFVQCLSCAREPSCGWESSELPNAPCPKVCPQCGGKVRRSNGDMVGYGWYVWTPERNRTHGKYVVLAETPLAERRAG